MPRYIDADALIISLAKDRSALVNNHAPHGELHRIDETIWKVVEAPTADVVPVVRGEWRQGKEFSAYPRVPFISTAYYCSNCEGEAYWDTDYGQQLFGFCPNCGAKMEDKP